MCQFLDTEEGESNVNNLITMDQLDMLLCTLPSEETFRWGRWGGEKLPDDIPFMFYDFCWQRAADLRAQVQSLEGVEETSAGAITCRRCAGCSRTCHQKGGYQ